MSCPVLSDWMLVSVCWQCARSCPREWWESWVPPPALLPIPSSAISVERKRWVLACILARFIWCHNSTVCQSYYGTICFIITVFETVLDPCQYHSRLFWKIFFLSYCLNLPMLNSDGPTIRGSTAYNINRISSQTNCNWFGAAVFFSFVKDHLFEQHGKS